MAKQYLWSTGETTPSIYVNPSEPTLYTLTITDENGNSATNKILVTPIVKPKYEPVAKIEADKTTCVCGEKVTLSACNSYCQGSQIIAYEWNTGDTLDTIEVEPAVTTVYSLRVTAANGLSSTASVLIKVETGEIELMKYLPDYWHENAEMIQIQKKSLNYLVYDVNENSEIITTEAFVNTANDARLKEWEKDLAIAKAETIDERRANVLEFFKRKGKLTESVIKEVVSFYYEVKYTGVEIKDSTIKVTVYPVDESVTNFNKVLSILNSKKPAHLGLTVSRWYCSWNDIKENFKTWEEVKNYGSWDEIKNYLPEV